MTAALWRAGGPQWKRAEGFSFGRGSRGLAALLGLLACAPLGAAEWLFDDPVTLAETAQGTTLSLNGHGPAGLAERDGRLAVVWEVREEHGRDVRLVIGEDGAGEEGPDFGEPHSFSERGAGRTPAVVPVGADGHFALLWSEEGRLWGRLWRDGELDAPIVMDNRDGQRPVTTVHGRDGLVVWQRAERDGVAFVRGRVRVEHSQLGRDWQGTARGAERAGERSEPALAAAGEATLLAWTHERRDHSRIRIARSDEPARDFGPDAALNPHPAEPVGSYGTSPRVDQPVLASDGNRLVAAGWMEERGDGVGPRFQVAISTDGGREFPDVEAVLGENPEPAYRTAPVLAVSGLGLVAAAWESHAVDDETGRTTGPPRIKVATRDGADDWGEPVEVPVADDGLGVRQPLLHLDGDGHAHLVWLEGTPDDGMRVRHVRARIQPD